LTTSKDGLEIKHFLGTTNSNSGFGMYISNIFHHQMLLRDTITFDNRVEKTTSVNDCENYINKSANTANYM